MSGSARVGPPGIQDSHPAPLHALEGPLHRPQLAMGCACALHAAPSCTYHMRSPGAEPAAAVPAAGSSGPIPAARHAGKPDAWPGACSQRCFVGRQAQPRALPEGRERRDRRAPGQAVHGRPHLAAVAPLPDLARPPRSCRRPSRVLVCCVLAALPWPAAVLFCLVPAQQVSLLSQTPSS